MRMNRFGYAAAMTSGLAAAIIGFAAAAHAAPDGPANAQQTISQLQTDGYTVIVNRLGATPLDEAAVVAVRPGQTFVRTDPSGDSVVTTVTSKTVYVDVK